MNQLYAEAGVKKKDTIATLGLRGLVCLGILAGAFLVLQGQVLAFVGAVIIVALFYVFPKLNIEYEYIFVDGQVDFDKISGKSKRKTMLRIDFEQVEVMAPASSHELDSYTYVKCEEKNFTSGEADRKVYVIVANVDQKKTKIFFEPNETMVGMMRQKSPRKVVTY